MTQVKIAELTNSEKEKFLEEKEKKLVKEVEKIKLRQENDMKAHQLKIQRFTF